MRRNSMRGATHALRAGVVAAAVGVGGMTVAARGAAAQTSWGGALSGSQQVPANASAASGFAVLSLTGNVLKVDVAWSGLVGGPAAAAHIHCCALPNANAAVAVPFVGFPTTIAGTYDNTFDLSNAAVYTSAFLSASGGTAAGAEAALLAGLDAGQAYVNIHDATYPGGEIRADLAPALTMTPEPTSLALAAAGLGAAAALARRRRRA